MIDKGINIKKIDLSGVSFPTSDASTCALIYTAVRNTYGFPLYLTNFKINDEKRDSVLVSPIILTDSVVINLGDYYLTISATAITATAGVNLIGATIDSDGDVEIGKNLEVDGTSTLTGDVTMSGDATIADDASIGGDATITGDTSIGGDANITGDADVTGVIKSMEKIVDSDGNLRFVEGNLTILTIEGMTISYAKWSLSGSHLMIVLAGDIAQGTSISSDYTIFCNCTLPAYIGSKIYPVWSDIIEGKNVTLRASDWTSQDTTWFLRFSPSINQLAIIKPVTNSPITMTADRHFRVQFDLLIDAE